MELLDRAVVVTGASAGIGAATAIEIARRGGHVALVARSADRLEALAEEIRGRGGHATADPCDLADPAAVTDLAARVRADIGIPDVLVNNAGAGRFLYLEETSADELAAMTAVPYQSALLTTRAFLPGMLERGSGWIVNVNSPASRMPWAGATGYAAARFALRGLTAALRLDLRGTGVGVSEVVPAKVSSEYFAHNPGAEQRIPAIARTIPTQTPEDVARAIVRVVESERRELVFPWQLRAFELSSRMLPGVTEWLSWRTGTRRTSHS